MAGRRGWRRERLLSVFLILVFFLAIGLSASVLPTLGAGGRLVDFDAFYIAGQLVAEGRAAAAYDPAEMARIQNALVGHAGFMPWTYPPMFDLLVAPLPLLPRGLAYALFTGPTLGVYLLLLARLAGPALAAVLLALAPPIYVALTIGQNAFLIGALMAAFALATLAGRTSAGVWLGLLALKPHLGVGLAVHALAGWRWRVLGLAAAVALGFALAATLAFGPGIWGAFLDGVSAAGRALETGFYPLFRMTSVYALVHTLGFAPDRAMLAQVAVAVVACGLVVWAVRAGVAPRRTLAMACFASALVSPYLYDYDMAVTGVGVALIAGEVLARTGWLERLLLLLLIWLAGGWGMFHALPYAGLPWEQRAAIARATVAFGAVASLLLMALAARILARPERPA